MSTFTSAWSILLLVSSNVTASTLTPPTDKVVLYVFPVMACGSGYTCPVLMLFTLTPPVCLMYCLYFLHYHFMHVQSVQKPETSKKLYSSSRTKGKCTKETSTLEVSGSPTNPTHAVSAQSNNQLLLAQTLGFSSPETFDASFQAPSSLLTPDSQEHRTSLTGHANAQHRLCSFWTPLDSQGRSPGLLESSRINPPAAKHPLEHAKASNPSKYQLEGVSNSHQHKPRDSLLNSPHSTSERNLRFKEKVEKIPSLHLDSGYGATTTTTTDQQHCWQLSVLERSPEEPHPLTGVAGPQIETTPETHNHFIPSDDLDTFRVPDTLDDLLLQSSPEDDTLTLEEEEDLKEKLIAATPSLSPVLNTLPSLQSVTPNVDKLLHRRVHRRVSTWRDRCRSMPCDHHLHDAKRIFPEQTGDLGGSKMNRGLNHNLESQSSVGFVYPASHSGPAGIRSYDVVVHSNNREMCSWVGNVGTGGETNTPAGSNVQPLSKHVHWTSDSRKEESNGSDFLAVKESGAVSPISKPQKKQRKREVVPLAVAKQPKKPAKHEDSRRKSARIRLQQECMHLSLQETLSPNQTPSSSQNASDSMHSAAYHDGKENKTPEINATLKSTCRKRRRGETAGDSSQVYPVRVARRVTALQNTFLEECFGPDAAENLPSPIPKQQEHLHTSRMEFSEPVRVSLHRSCEEEVGKHQESKANMECSLEISPDATVPSDGRTSSGPLNCTQLVPTKSHSQSNTDSVPGAKV